MIDNDIDEAFDAVKDIIVREVLLGVGYVFEFTDDYRCMIIKRLDNQILNSFVPYIKDDDLKRDWLLAKKMGIINTQS